VIYVISESFLMWLLVTIAKRYEIHAVAFSDKKVQKAKKNILWILKRSRVYL